MLATLLIWLSAAVAVLALADLFLSKAQKDWLDNAVIKLWSILDEGKKLSFTDWLKTPQAKWWLAISLGLFYMGIIVFVGEPTFELVILAICVAIVVAVITSPIFELLLDRTPTTRLSRGLAIFSLLAVCGLWIALGIAVIRGANLRLLLLPLRLIALCAIVIWFARALGYIVRAILYVGEFMVRRISEYPKGPVLALSAFFGGVCALIKAFG